MLIGIEAERANTRQKTGVEHYAKQLIIHLALTDHINKYVLYLRTAPEQWFLDLPENFTVKVIPFPIFWTQIRISLEMLFNPVDVLFIPASALPLIHPRRSVVAIHDVGWRYFPESFTFFMRRFLEWSTNFAVKRASRIIAVSSATKKDLEKFYNVGSDKITVIHHGFELEKGSGFDQSLVKNELPRAYVLFLSTIQPRKNLLGLLEAFQKLKTEYPELPHKLVVVGKPGWKFENILSKIKNHENVVYLNHIGDDAKALVLKQADMLVLPSFYEGFGMQILEAFAANVPVGVSNTSSMPEVAGEAAVYFNPHNLEEMKNAMKIVLLDKSLADRLRAKGSERLKSFSWDKTARETLDVFINA